MVNFYRRFLPKIAATLKPLTDLLRGNPKSLDWSAAAAEAFQTPKRPWSQQCCSLTPPQAQLSPWRWMPRLPRGRRPAAAREPGMASTGIFFTEIVARTGPVLYV
jgi:hypothetical protein